MNKFFALGVVSLLNLILVNGQSYQLTVDPEFKYRVIWNIDMDNRVIHFDLLVETQGFVGFGVSPDGKIKGADLLVSSIAKNGMLEIQDLHGVGETESPMLDDVQDWVVTMLIKNGTHTNINFFRAFDTGDDKGDVVFQDREIFIVWAYSPNNSQVFRYHGDEVKSGMFKVNLFSAIMSGWLDHSNHKLESTSPLPTTKSTTQNKGTSHKKNINNPKNDKHHDPSPNPNLHANGPKVVKNVVPGTIVVQNASFQEYPLISEKESVPGSAKQHTTTQLSITMAEKTQETMYTTTATRVTATPGEVLEKSTTVVTKIPKSFTEIPTKVKVIKSVKKDAGNHISRNCNGILSISAGLIMLPIIVTVLWSES